MKCLKALMALMLITGLVSASTTFKGDAAITNGLLAFYKLDETSGTTVTDSSGNGYDGTLVSGVVNNAGVYNKAYYLDGNDDYANLCDEPTCTYSKSMCDNGCSFCVWKKDAIVKTAESGFQMLLTRWNSPNLLFMYLQEQCTGNGQLGFFIIYNGTQTASTSSGAYTNGYGCNVGNWDFICGVFNGTTSTTGVSTLYLNGVDYTGSRSGTAIRINDSSTRGWGRDMDFRMGAGYNINRDTNATIDQVMIYNRPLTDDEVLNLYEAGIATGNYNTPTNNNIFESGDAFNVDIDVGVNSGLINLTYTGVDTTKYTLYDGTVHNQTNIFLDMINSTFWTVHGTDTPILGAKNIQVDAWGGSTSDLQSQWNPTINLTFNPPSYPGTCTTPNGLKAQYHFYPLSTYTVLNLTNLHNGNTHYCSDVNCNNINITFGTGAQLPTYKLENVDYTLVVNTNIPPLQGMNQSAIFFYVTIGGYNYNNDYDIFSDSIGTPKYVQSNITDYSTVNNLYFITPRYEEDNTVVDASEVDVAEIKLYCQDYAPYTIDMALYNNRDTFMLTTKEKPLVETTVTNNTFTSLRKKQAVTSWENLTTYNNLQTSNILTYYFVLADYTGSQRKSGNLDIRTNVNGSLVSVFREKWFYDTIYGVELINGSDYQIRTYIPGSTSINYGFLTPTESSYKTLVVTQPPTLEALDHYEGLYYKYLDDKDSNTIGYAYTFTTASTINWVNFTVWNSSNEVVYQSTDTAASGQMLYTITGGGDTYRSRFEWDVDDHSWDYIEYIWSRALNTTAVLRHNLDLSGDYNSDMANFNLLGVSGAKIERFTSWFLIGVVALIASAGNYGLIAMGVVILSGVLSWIGYLPEEYFYILVVLTAVIALLAKLGSDKK